MTHPFRHIDYEKAGASAFILVILTTESAAAESARGSLMKVIRGFRELVAEAEAGVEAIEPDEVRRRLAVPGTLLVDLRDVRELRREGSIPGALHVPRGMLEFWIDPDSPYYRREFEAVEALILYCNKGWRSALAARSLQEMGVTAVAHLAGGMEHWQESGGEIESPPEKGDSRSR